ncbi:MAG TPA: hemerythrin domain-containing protein [Acidimicrobiales bacterium]|nr:hemerythrin domain-containing protein [Acidimicrobiales bacterium]
MATTPRAPDRPPELTAFTVVHRALRRDAARLAAAAAGLQGGDARRARALRTWYGEYRAQLAAHHSLEDELWFPALAEHVPTFDRHAGRLAREHAALDDASDRLTAALDRLAATGAGPEAVGPARDAAGELSALLDGHLRFEDGDILPLYLRHFTRDEYAEIERRSRKRLDLRRTPFAVPWILGAATPDERARLLATAPRAFTLLWFATRHRQARLSARALGPDMQEVN